MSALRPRDLFPTSFRRQIRARVSRGPTLLAGPVGSGTGDLVRAELERAKAGVWLQPTAGATLPDVVADVVGQLVRGIDRAGIDAFDGDSARAQRARLELARRFGSGASNALDIARGAAPNGWTLTDAVGARGSGDPRVPPTLVAIINAHHVPKSLVWELRELANNERVLLLATTRREHLAQLVGAKAPLHGNASVFELPRLQAADWARRLPEPVHPADLEWLLACTRARAASTLEVLDFRESGHSIRSAWPRAVTARRHEAENVLNLAAGVHAYGPRLLLAIASGQAPYGAIPGAPSQRVARALAKLRDVDLIEQEVPRVWQIADPVLHGALVARTRVALAHGEADHWLAVRPPAALAGIGAAS